MDSRSIRPSSAPAFPVTLAIANYRSLRELIVPLGPLNVVTGPNGSGKSNLYRALRLLALTAQAAEASQVLVVSHAPRLVAALERDAASQPVVLERRLGATSLANADSLDLPPWKWPAR
ncbi:AAA ATPase domain-containing protein [Paraburkholderia caballeronis]|uniref:AAA ATPase domain-containing protein n=1 Tax=Paraburkholderia caballeronis TaxID=416943 RepID=A0A1H7JDY4_9BURK|nr:AAA family ATPase [Paraburkholderia caballeronis]PXW27460.1 AAA ATPase-like protein [Paraburkholderia caballeronis]PXX02934.1 AAA ATPase-like protein [Paraburkholderia caballeronis]RAK03659.1 AAA ATPase-like protein [Paraburkholderia caballeronis]SEK72889.1 AAA ATPase domain-containing protein [Paraburkholderia caballeronis]